MTLRQRTPMKRSTPLVAHAPMSRGTSVLKRSEMKRRRRKVRPGHDQKMLDACREEPCWLLMPRVRCAAIETVVPAHRNQGKGKGLKTPDRLTVPACFNCHRAYDQTTELFRDSHTRDEKRGAFDLAFAGWEPYRAKKMGAPTK